MLNVAMISYHTCPLAILGGKDTGGMNVYVREVTRYLGTKGIHVDVFTRSQDEHVPQVLHDLGYGNRVVHIPAGPEHPMPKKELATYLPHQRAMLIVPMSGLALRSSRARTSFISPVNVTGFPGHSRSRSFCHCSI